MRNLIGALAGAAIDRRDGEGGIKGAAIGALAQGATRRAPALAALALAGWGVRKALQARRRRRMERAAAA